MEIVVLLSLQIGSLTSFLPICMPVRSFSSLIALAGTSSIMLNSSGKSRYLHLEIFSLVR